LTRRTLVGRILATLLVAVVDVGGIRTRDGVDALNQAYREIVVVMDARGRKGFGNARVI
jgi:hypothetical protein